MKYASVNRSVAWTLHMFAHAFSQFQSDRLKKTVMESNNGLLKQPNTYIAIWSTKGFIDSMKSLRNKIWLVILNIFVHPTTFFIPSKKKFFFIRNNLFVVYKYVI